MTSPAIPKTANLALCAALAAMLVFEMFALPFIAQAHPALALMLAVILIPFSTPLWSLMHEAIHYNLHPDKKTNDFLARAISVLFGASFNVLRFGHLMHHRFNRKWESEYYDARKTNWLLSAPAYYFKLMFGLYLSEVATTFLIALVPAGPARKIAAMIYPDPERQHAIVNGILKDKYVRRVRMDCLLIVALYGLSFYLFGAYWHIPAIILLGRCVAISVMDNAYHYGTPPDNSVPALELKLPGFLEKFVLHFNYHLTHHENTKLSWIELRQSHEAEKTAFAKNLFAALFAQFKGPLKQPDA